MLSTTSAIDDQLRSVDLVSGMQILLTDRENEKPGNHHEDDMRSEKACILWVGEIALRQRD